MVKLDVVKWLVDEGMADVDKAINDGRTPLHTATQNGHLEIVKWLVEEEKAETIRRMTMDVLISSWRKAISMEK